MRRLRAVRRSLNKESLLTLVHVDSTRNDRYESGRSLQRSPVRVSFLSSRQASVRVGLGRSAGPEPPQVQPHISVAIRVWDYSSVG